MAVSTITGEAPHDDDVARVRTTLETAGRPFDDEPLAPHAPDPATPEDQP
ncbi:hypothetical protein [Gordonia iterans]|nr:hypothetical protein [Gordonia iterans]